MRTVILSDHLQSRTDAILSAGARQQERYDAEYHKALRAAAEQQKRYDAEYEGAQRAAQVEQKRLDAEHEEAQRAAQEEQRRLDAEHKEAERAANALQEIYDARYEAAERAADERAREIASVRADALTALLRMRLWSGLRLLVRSIRMRRAPRPKREIAPSPPRKRALSPVRKTATAPRRRVAPQPKRAIASTRLPQRQANEFRRLQDSRAGEQRLPKRLAEQLADTWTLIQGYLNNKGEVDFVLVGPPGVCAIEVKFVRGDVLTRSDGTWWREKYDNYGNHVGTDRIMDAGGRSPGQQVRAVASELERYLRGRMPQRLSVRTAVVLTHERSSLGKVDAGVDVVATLRNLKPHNLVPAPGAGLSKGEVDKIVELINQDHRSHEERRGKRGHARGRRRSGPAKSRSH